MVLIIWQSKNFNPCKNTNQTITLVIFLDLFLVVFDFFYIKNFSHLKNGSQFFK